MISDKNAPFALILTSVFIYALFIIPVIVVIYGEKGVNIGDFMLIQGIARLFICPEELPTGYLGNIFSRKKNLLAGNAFWIAGYATLLFGSGFTAVLSAELCFSTALSLFSGTSEAYLFDLLKRINKEKLFHRYYSLQRTALNLSCLFATVAGTVIFAEFGANATIAACLFAAVCSLSVLIFIPDVTESKRVVVAKNKIRDICDIAKRVLTTASLRRIVLMMAFFGTGTGVAYWGLQPLLILKEMPTAVFGGLMTFNLFCRVFWSAIAAKLMESFGLAKTCLLTAGIIGVALGRAFFSVADISNFALYAFLSVMVFAAASFDLTNVIGTSLINREIASNERSTVLSVNSMVGSCIGGTFFILLKPLYEYAGTAATTRLFPLVFIPVVFITLLVVKAQARGSAQA